MISRGNGARRPLTYVGVLVVALAVTVLATGAGAASKCHPLATASYTDPTGDGSGTNAPDIKGVTVTSYDEGQTSFQIAFANESQFGTDMLVRTYFDTDNNPATGTDKGFEYMIQAQRHRSHRGGGGDTGTTTDTTSTDTTTTDTTSTDTTTTDPDTTTTTSGTEWKTVPKAVARIKCEDQAQLMLFKWNGTSWQRIDTRSLGGWFGDGNLNLQINAGEIGNAVAFNFAVYAASNVTYDNSGSAVLTDASFDWAPDSGTYSYQPLDYSTYNDPAGDGSGDGAPDITRVVVSRWHSDHAPLTFSVGIANVDEFGDDMLVRTYIDSDSNATTGNANGFDYVIQAQRPSYDSDGSVLRARAVAGAKRKNCHDDFSLLLFKWDGTTWQPQDTDSLQGEFRHGLRFAIDPADLGGAKTFNFAVYAAAKVTFDDSGHPSIVDAAYDWAPDTGSYSFPLAAESGQFQGVYRVHYRVIRSHHFGNMRRGSVSTRTWRFVNQCTKRGKRCTTKAVTGDQVTYKLSRTGKTYKARAGRRFDCSAGYRARGTEQVKIAAKKSRWIKGKWRVTNWSGTVNVVSPGNGAPACGGTASYTASLTGVLK